MTNAEARFSIALRPRQPEGSLGRTAQDGHLVSHTAPELSSREQNVKRLCRAHLQKCSTSVHIIWDIHWDLS